MSGPKTSSYVLTEEQRRQLEERQKNIQERDLLREKGVENLKKIKAIFEDICDVCIEAGESRPDVEAFQKGYEELSSVARKVSNYHERDSIEIIKKQISNLESFCAMVQKLQVEGQEVKKRVTTEYKKELNKAMVIGFELSFAGLGANRKERDNVHIQKIQGALKKIEGAELPQELRLEFEQLQKRAMEIKSLDFLENFCSLQVYPFVHKCEYYQEHVEEFEDLSMQYGLLAKECGEEKKTFSFSEEAMGMLRSEIARLEKALLAQKESAYISEAIDEAMRDMGYELVGERNVQKRSGKRFRNGLYLFEEGTAVNVTFSDNGQISMELGALDTIDRMPTETEASELTSDMEAFCADYEELERRLSQKGISVNRLTLLPPTGEYAQVINTSDYELVKPVEVYKQGKAKKKMTRGKYLYKEG